MQNNHPVSVKPALLSAMNESAAPELQEGLGSQFVCITASTYDDGMARIASGRSRVDLRLCERRFAGSMMVDFLDQVRKSWSDKRIPFICLSMKKGTINTIDPDREVYQALELVVKSKGAKAFINYTHWIRQVGAMGARRMLLAAVSSQVLPEYL